MTLAISLASGCGGSASERPVPAARVRSEASAGGETASTATPAQAAEAAPPTSRGTIPRGELVVVLEAGLGRFLQGVGTEPHLQEGRFVGFRLTRLYPDDRRFASVDLRAGDTVTRVNGRPIERPEQALRVWQELRVASELMIEYLRGGERRELRFTIQDQ